MTHKVNVGSRRQVWNGTAKKTSGGLTKSDLVMSHGRIVSKSKHISAKKEMRLVKHGYGTKKGKFGCVKLYKKTHTRKHKKSHKKHKGGGDPKEVASTASTPTTSSTQAGGSGNAQALSPALADHSMDGEGITNYASAGSNSVQVEAGMAGGSRKGGKHHRHGGSRKGGKHHRHGGKHH